MPLWGRNDQAVTANSTTTKETSNGAPMGTWALVKGDQVNRVDGANAHFGNTSSGSRAGVDVNMFGNTTVGAFLPNVAVGVFGVDATEIGISGGLASLTVTSAGSGYGANAVVTVTFANGTSNVAYANSTVSLGRVTALTANITTAISGGNPAVTVAAPAAINITANTSGVSNTADTILVTSANSRWQVGDRLYYNVPAGNTAITGLTGNSYYYVTFTNTTAIAVSTTSGGANANIAETRVGAGEVHTIQGDTATGYATLGGGANKGVAHAGWVLRTEGTGGRAGRVQYETLVAMGSLGAQTAAFGTPANVADASDDTFLPDS